MPNQQPNKQVGAVLDKVLYMQVKAQAVLENRKIGEVIDDAIRAYLSQIETPAFTRKKAAH